MRARKTTSAAAVAVLAALAFILTSTAISAMAQQVVVFSLEKALADSKKGKAAADKLKDREAALSKDFEAKVKALEKKFSDFEKQASTMNQEAAAKRQQELVKERDDLLATRQKAAEELQKLWEDNYGPLIEKARTGARDYCRNHGCQIVLEAQQGGVFFADSALDITAEITKAIDK